MDAAIAWRRGEIVFEDTPLAEAIAEMNRYSPVVLAMDVPQGFAYPVSGVFRSGDSEAFAKAVADIYGLELARRPNRVLLSAKTARR